MLAPDDAALVRRHPSLPGLRVVLDPAAVATGIARTLPALDVISADATYLRLKPPSSALVGYRLTQRDGTLLHAYLRTVSGASDAKLHKAVSSARGDAGNGPTAALINAHCAVLVHPSDHDLPAIARIAEPDQRRRLLARILRNPVADDWGVECLRYKPERRWVARLEGAAGKRMLLKVHRASRYGAAVAGAAALAGVPVPTARLMGSSRRQRITIHEWVDGTTASHMLADRAADPDVVAAAVGALLAQLHTAEPVALSRPLTASPDERASLAAGVAAIAALDPAAGARAAHIAGQVIERLSTGPARRVRCGAAVGPRLLHGDCSFDQVVVGDHGPVLIDVDRATTGDIHTDLGQLLADLAMRRLTGQLTDGRVGAAVLTGYADAGGRIDTRHLAAVTAGRLLRMAPEPFRYRHDGWADTLAAVLEDAAVIMRDGA